MKRVVLAIAVSVAACGGTKDPPVVGTSVIAGPQKVAFTFDSLDDRPVSSEAMLGKPSVIAFVQTGDQRSQAQVRFLMVMAANDADKTNYALVALEPRMNRELVEVYKSSLGVTFPVALADAQSLVGQGPFGEWKGIPTVVVLDRDGKVRWRAEGRIVRAEEIRAELYALK